MHAACLSPVFPNIGELQDSPLGGSTTVKGSFHPSGAGRAAIRATGGSMTASPSSTKPVLEPPVGAHPQGPSPARMCVPGVESLMASVPPLHEP